MLIAAFWRKILKKKNIRNATGVLGVPNVETLIYKNLATKDSFGGDIGDHHKVGFVGNQPLTSEEKKAS